MVVNKISLSNYANTRSNLKPAPALNFCSESASEKPEKKRSLTAKKWGVALAGPFSGNLVNGKPGRAFAYLGIFTGLATVGSTVYLLKSSVGKAIGGLAALAFIATYIYGIVDVVKHVKPDKE